MESEESGRAQHRKGIAEARFAEENKSDTDTARIIKQMPAKVGPDLHERRELRRHPPTLGPQRVCSAERATTQTPAKGHSKSKNSDRPNDAHPPRIGVDPGTENSHHNVQV